MNHPPSADVPPNLVTTTTTAPWQISHFVKRNEATVGALRLRLVSSAVHQQVEGFGGCFNETGWEVLSLIDPHARAAVLLALFDRMAGCGFNLGRMPIGANDYSLVWYSLDDVSDDLILEYFNIERDRAHLIPLHPRGTTTQPGPEHLGIAVVPARVDEDKWPLRVHAGPSQRPQARAGRGGDGPVVPDGAGCTQLVCSILLPVCRRLPHGGHRDHRRARAERAKLVPELSKLHMATRRPGDFHWRIPWSPFPGRGPGDRDLTRDGRTTASRTGFHRTRQSGWRAYQRSRIAVG